MLKTVWDGDELSALGDGFVSRFREGLRIFGAFCQGRDVGEG